VPVITSGITTTIDPNFKRPYTDEITIGLERQLMPDLRLNVVYTNRREQNLQVSANPANPYDPNPTTAVDPGLDGVIGTSDDGTYQFYQRLAATNPTFITDDPTRKLEYNGLEISATKRFSKRWQMVAGYTRSKNKLSGASIDTSPNLLINANGNVTSTGYADKPNQFKLTGSYLLPFQDIMVAANLRSSSGPTVTRQISQRLTFGGTQTINLEPLGAHRLPTLNTVDLRASKSFKFGTRSISADVDFYNLTNANTVWEVRTLTPSITVRQGGTGDPNTIAQFNSPTQVLGPRIVRFGVSMKF